MTLKVLGIDAASAAWSSNGSAAIAFDTEAQVFKSLDVPAIVWPSVPLTPLSLAAAIDAYARANGICAVSIDGPQGWRDSSTALGTPGVGRRCEYACKTQGKTGIYPRTFPGNQRKWIEFCIDLFNELLAKPDVQLAEPNVSPHAPTTGYYVLECYPTSAWRTSGLKPLPGKSKRPELHGYFGALVEAYGLPNDSIFVHSHDDLQAIVAALTAVGVVGGPTVAVPRGTAASLAITAGAHRRIEGFIWDVQPLGGKASAPDTCDLLQLPRAHVGGCPEIRVTQAVIDQVSKAGLHQSQIAFKQLPGGTKRAPTKIQLTVAGENYSLIVGDKTAIWRSHQDSTTQDSFEQLFALLADRPNEWQPVNNIQISAGT